MGQFMWEVVKISCLFECFTCATSFCHCRTSGWAGTRPEKLIRSTRHRCSRQLRVRFSIFEWMFWSLGRGCELWGLRTGKRCSVPRQLKARSLFNFTVKSITCLLPQELKQNGKVCVRNGKRRDRLCRDVTRWGLRIGLYIITIVNGIMISDEEKTKGIKWKAVTVLASFVITRQGKSLGNILIFANNFISRGKKTKLQGSESTSMAVTAFKYFTELTSWWNDPYSCVVRILYFAKDEYFDETFEQLRNWRISARKK